MANSVNDDMKYVQDSFRQEKWKKWQVLNGVARQVAIAFVQIAEGAVFPDKCLTRWKCARFFAKLAKSWEVEMWEGLVNIFSLIALEPTISSFRLSEKFKFMEFFQQRHQLDMTYVVLLL